MYEILKQIYCLNKKDLNYAIQVFSSLTDKIDRDYLNRKMYLKYHKEMVYTKTEKEHIINNLYKDEVSVLTVKNSYLLITTNQNNTSFFQILDQYASDFFICDFSNMDYFWLSSLKMLATSNAV